MKKLLLTGFEPFLNFTSNPTINVVKALEGKIVNEHKIVGEILTVDFEKSGDQLIDAINKVKPDAVISLGLAAGRFKVTPERIAVNCNDSEADNKGWKPEGEKIFEDGPDGIFSTLPIKEMVDRLVEANIPAEISNSAGLYLCNNVMYHGLYHFQKLGLNIRSGFIHIPASHEIGVQHKRVPSWSERDLIEAVTICIECL